MKTSISQEVAKTVIETWRSEDGTSWYRKWSDGWIEQGGYLSPSQSIINFPIGFSNIYYSITKNIGSSQSNNPKDSNIGFYNLTQTSASTTGANVYTFASYYACGY